MKKEFTKYLKSLDEKDLVKELQKLYNKIPEVAKYYEMELSVNNNKIIDGYKNELKREYFPARGYGHARSGVSRKIVLDFKKIAVHNVDVIDLWLYRTQMMAEYTMAYGDIDMPFYDSLAKGFEAACKLIEKEQLQKHYANRCQEVMGILKDIGWGIREDLKDIYDDYIQGFE